jgi:hypothetical protein
LQVRYEDTRTNIIDATRDDVGFNTQGNLQAMLLKPVCNAWRCHLRRERWNANPRHWGCVYRWHAGEPAGVLRTALISFFAAAHLAGSDKYCNSCLESVWAKSHFVHIEVNVIYDHKTSC